MTEIWVALAEYYRASLENDLAIQKLQRIEQSILTQDMEINAGYNPSEEVVNLLAEHGYTQRKRDKRFEYIYYK
jgi:hypothetical protein